MTVFLIAAGLLTLAVVLRLLWPLWSGARASALTLAELNGKVYRDQMAELERDLARGQLTEASYQEAREELQRRLLQDVAGAADAQPKVLTAPAGRGRWTAIALSLAVPLGAAGLYSRVGNAAAIQAADEAKMQTPEEIQRIVSHLAEALEKSPNNPQGWILLGRAYTKMERFTEAAAAYDHAAPLIDKNPDLLVEQADVLTAAAGDNLEGRPMALVRKAIAIEPRHPMALMLMGMSAYRNGEHAAAIVQWRKLLDVLPPGSDEAKAVQANIAQAQAEGGLTAEAPKGAPAVPAAVSTGDAPASAPAAARAGTGVSGEVTLAPDLVAQLRPDDVLFIVARGDDGSRAPVAVLRRKASDLPVQFTLDDTMAMMPERTISKAKSVVIVARISRSGQPIAQPGDLTSEPSVAVQPGTGGLKLVISRKL